MDWGDKQHLVSNIWGNIYQKGKRIVKIAEQKSPPNSLIINLFDDFYPPPLNYTVSKTFDKDIPLGLIARASRQLSVD